MEHGRGKLQKFILSRLSSRAALEPYVHAIASLKDFQSTNDELIAAAELLDDCAVLERATVAYLAGPEGAADVDIAAVRRALRSLAQRGLAGEWKAQRVQFQRDRTGTVSAHPVSGRLSYWYRTGT